MGTVVISPSAISNLPKGGAIKGLSASSNVFVAKIKIPDDKSWSGATKEEPVFLLNNQDFIDLQLYINSALKLPGSTALFKSTYTKKSFDPYFGSDPSLYDVSACNMIKALALIPLRQWQQSFRSCTNIASRHRVKQSVQ